MGAADMRPVLRQPFSSVDFACVKLRSATSVIANLFGPDLGYVVIIVLVVLVGGSQLPKIARNIGTAGKEFRKAQQEAEEEEEERRVRAAQSTVPPAVSPPGSPASPEDQSSLRLSPAELDALLKAREDQVHREAAG